MFLPTFPRPNFVQGLFGYRANAQGIPGQGNPNCSDAGTPVSVSISRAMFDALGIPNGLAEPSDPGHLLEVGLRAWLTQELGTLAPMRAWFLDPGAVRITEFDQYEHLARIESLVRQDASKMLRDEYGTDYLIAPDVTVGLDTPFGRYLHAMVSCKWTLRSDRAQNVRHEAILMIRHRRGRLPHIVAVTAEPLPSRVASLARGTGELDCTYHVCLPELTVAVAQTGSRDQRDILDELVFQNRLADISFLPHVLCE